MNILETAEDRDVVCAYTALLNTLRDRDKYDIQTRVKIASIPDPPRTGDSLVDLFLIANNVRLYCEVFPEVKELVEIEVYRRRLSKSIEK